MVITSGVEIHPPGVERPLLMTVHVICCSCDLPAKALVQNFVQFNGFYGCGFCKQPGTSIRTENGGTVLAFLYDQQLPKGPARTQQQCMQYAKDAVKECSSVCLFSVVCHSIANSFVVTGYWSERTILDELFEIL